MKTRFSIHVGEHMYKKRIFLYTLSAFSLVGCQSFDFESIGVDEGDNAALCIRADIDPTWSESSAHYSRVELPKDYKVTPEQLSQLVAACGR